VENLNKEYRDLFIPGRKLNRGVSGVLETVDFVLRNFAGLFHDQTATLHIKKKEC